MILIAVFDIPSISYKDARIGDIPKIIPSNASGKDRGRLTGGIMYTISNHSTINRVGVRRDIS